MRHTIPCRAFGAEQCCVQCPKSPHEESSCAYRLHLLMQRASSLITAAIAPSHSSHSPLRPVIAPASIDWPACHQGHGVAQSLKNRDQLLEILTPSQQQAAQYGVNPP